MRFIASSLCIALAACAVTGDDENGTIGTGSDDLAAELSFEQYHSQAQIHGYLTNAAAAHPDLVTFTKVGTSRQGRDIDVIAISHRDPTTVPAIYFNGTHHGDEKASTEGILALADYLVTHHAEPKVKSTLDAYAIYLQPLVNPDGHEAHTREDSQGADPNRDYESPLSNPASAYRVPETRVVRDLVAKIRPRGVAAYHSGIEEVIWPWCYTADAPSNAAAIAAAGKLTAEAMGFDRYLQSFEDYPTRGELIDFAYAKHGALALTFEISGEKTPAPAQLAGVVENSVRGALAFIDAVKATDQGQIPAAGTMHDVKGNEGKFGRRVGPRLE